MKDDAVVISGCGLVAPCGLGVGSFIDLAKRNDQVIAEIPATWHEHATFRSRVWAPLPPFDWKALGFPTGTCMQTDRVTRMGLLATEEALRQADLVTATTPASYSLKRPVTLPVPSRSRCGVAIGSSLGGYQSLIASDETHRFAPLAEAMATIQQATAGQADSAYQKLHAALQHARVFNPFSVAMTMPNATAARVAQRYSCEGPCRTPSMACAGGTIAIGQAYDLIRHGSCDLVIAGGVEALVDRLGGSFRGFDAAGALTRPDSAGRDWNRPFDAASNGFLLAEGGAGILVLERADHCRARGGTALAEIIAWSETTSPLTAIMTTEADGQAVTRCHQQALAQAGLQAEAIDYINAHGTGTVGNDVMESELISSMYRPDVTVVSSKALVGHSLAASGAIETIATVLALEGGLAHGNPTLTDVRQDLNMPHRCRQQQTFSHAVTVSAAFGGHNAVLVLRRPDAG